MNFSRDRDRSAGTGRDRFDYGNLMQTRDIRAGSGRLEAGALTRALAAAIACLATLGAIVPAAAQSKHAAMVIDANTGEALHADKADEQRFPASLTKMMTLYMVFEQLETGRLTPTTKLKISQEAASAQPTKLDLEPGEQIAVMDAIKALITKSANDMAIALAEAVGGTETKFAELMTQKARALGMRNTTFRNASGLPDSEQVTTARDMLTLALHLQDDFPKYFPLFALKSFSYNGSTYRNHNTMLNSFEGVDGIKTGYTRMSGFNLVTSLRRGDKHLVGAVFGGATAGTRNLTMRMLLTRALLKASTKKTRRPAPVLVARAKPAVRPAPATTNPAAVAAAKPKPPQIATAQPVIPAAPAAQAKPAAATPAAVAAVPAAVASGAAATAPTIEAILAAAAQDPPSSEPATSIEIAKVRHVMVAPRVRRTAFVIAPEPAAAQPPEEATPAVAAAAAALAGTTEPEPAATPNIAAPPPVPVASTVALPLPEPQPPMAARSSIAPLPTDRARPEPSASRPVDVAAAAVAPHQAAAIQRGQPPSTLQAQAQSLSRGLALPPQAVNAAPSANGFQIQIGAYASVTEAERMLRETQARASGLLKAATPVTAAVQKENRLLYRARFAGFDAKGAANTCVELRRAAIDCFVMKAE